MYLMNEKALTYDDIILVPQYSEIESRHEVDLTMDLNNYGYVPLPIIASPMDTVCGEKMAETLFMEGGMGVLHRYADLEDRVTWVENLCYKGIVACVAIGATGEFFEEAQELYNAGARVFCLDVAHGHHKYVQKAIKKLRIMYDSRIHIMAGNVATSYGTEALIKWGADSIRVGIGGGSVCTTRIKTGHGMPNVTALLEAKKVKDDCGSNVSIIADGGIRTSGDMVKAFACGADAVMLGSLLAGCDESPGEVYHDEEGRAYMKFRGMASEAAQRDWRGKSSVVEGESTKIPFKGSVKNILDDIAGGIKSGVSYSGLDKLSDLCDNAMYVVQSGASIAEGKPHALS